MKKIIISGEIGWDVMAFEIDEQLKSANGEDVEFIFNTPGGFISEGNVIDDLILSYKKDFSSAQIMATVIEAQSYGSYLLSNPAFDLIVARTNSVVMIHNPLMGIIGDYKELKKTADVLERKAAMFAERYSERMGKSIKDIRSMMDEGTFFIGGKEIVEAGIADEVITDKEALKDSATLKAKAETRIELLKIKIKNSKDDFEKIVAMANDGNNLKNIAGGLEALSTASKSIQPASGGKNNQEVIMNKDELKEKHPDIHAEITNEAKMAGIDQEKDERGKRIESLIKMKDNKDFEGIPEIMARIDDGILKDESVQTVELGIFAILRNPAMKAAMDTRDIGDLNPGGNGTVSGEENLTEDNEGF